MILTVHSEQPEEVTAISIADLIAETAAGVSTPAASMAAAGRPVKTTVAMMGAVASAHTSVEGALQPGVLHTRTSLKGQLGPT